ncbi:MAG: hypothetical protein ACYCQI_00340 [Gammaproteobacteria bacterium]
MKTRREDSFYEEMKPYSNNLGKSFYFSGSLGLYRQNRDLEFKKLIEVKQKRFKDSFNPQTLGELEKKLQDNETLLKTKEEQLHEVRRAARDNMLNSVLGELKLPGGISSAVMGIAIGYDKVKFGSQEVDGSLHQLKDQTTDTKTLEKEIEVLKESIERLKSEIANAKELNRERLRRLL